MAKSKNASPTKKVKRNHDQGKVGTKAKRTHASHVADHLPSYTVKNIKVEEIKVPENRRKTNPATVDDIKESILRIGFQTPLTVRLLTGGEKRLITGGHRLEAARAAGMKTVPCFVIKGEVNARLWEIAENLYRNDLTVLEQSNQIVEWMTLTGADEVNEGGKGKGGRPKGGMSEAARKLPARGTEAAKRKRIDRAKKIAALEAKVQKAIVDAGLDDSQAKLLAVAKENGEAARLEKVKQVKAGRGGSESDRRGDGDTEKSAFDLLKREWEKAGKLRKAWKGASKQEQRRFVAEVLKHSLDDDGDDDGGDDWK
jgi:ParB-like chromosome segregation protein Spo0J